MSNKEKNRNNPFVLEDENIKQGVLEGFSYRMRWTEDVFVSGFKNKSVEVVGRVFDFSKTKIVLLLISGMIFVLFSRVFWLQVVRGDYYSSLADGNKIRVERIEPKRGVVYDSRMKPLVRNTANFMLYLIPADLPKEKADKDYVFRKLESILLTDINKIKEEAEKIKRGSIESFSPLFVLDNIEYEKAMMLYLESDKMPGVVLSNRTRREYINYGSLSMSHLLGYTGKINEKELDKFGDEYSPIDYIGKTGLEYFWENELKGVNGEKSIEVDALGKEKKIIEVRQAYDGRNLVLSIDIELQKKIEDLLKGYLEKLKLDKASIVAMDPRNGEILAMVSLPTYDNNIFAKGISKNDYDSLLSRTDKPLFNRSISGEYPSGSTIKPVMVAAALQEGVINENTSFLSNGGIRIGQWFFPDWKAGGHGVTDAKKALAESVNTFFYYIGGGYQDFVGLGVDRIVKNAKLFGLGEQTGIDITGESSGFVPTKEWKEDVKKEKWYIGDTYHVSIGQGDVLVTPLQVANFTTFFANGGFMYRPHLVREILSGSDNKMSKTETAPIRSGFINDSNISIVRQGMRQAVASGSARSLSLLPFEVAGKTGTAQFSSVKKPHAWFTCFAPYDKPTIVLTVLVEEGEEGSSVSVPLAGEILKWYMEDRK